MNLFHNYLRHCLGETVFPCSFINLKKYENSPSPGLKKNLKKIYEELSSSESVYKHPFFIGYHRHFRNYENLGGLLKEFSKKKRLRLLTPKHASLPYRSLTKGSMTNTAS